MTPTTHRRPTTGNVHFGLTAATIAAWLAVALFWLSAALSQGTPRLGDRAAVLAAVVLTLLLAGRSALRALLAEDPERASRARVLLVLVAISFVVAWIGIEHEVAEHYYQDEGIYITTAQRINDGQIFRPRFIYPHLLFYLDAFTLWSASRFQGAVSAVARAAFGLDDWQVVEWLLLRLVASAMGALTVVPVFLAAGRLGGRLAAIVAGLLAVFSPLYNEGFHVNICDVPSAFFAAVCLMYVARLLERETLRDYLLAGIAAGLAAGTKYPAGVVAVGIVAVWIRGRLRRRRFSYSLLASGLASLAAFLAVNPSLLVFPKAALTAPQGLFFGLRQYSTGSWIGVVKASNGLFYGRHLLASYGLPALVAAAVGLPLLSRARRRRLLWFAAFPAVYLILIVLMKIVVVRNLYPALPALSAVLGVAIGGVASGADRLLRPTPRRAVVAAFLLAALALPVFRTVSQAVGFARPSTRQLARAWIEERLPAGARILKEVYTPHLDPSLFRVDERRFAARIPLEEVRRVDVDFVLLTPNAYRRFLDRGAHLLEHQELYARWYEEALAELPPVVTFSPTRWRRGPRLELYRSEPRRAVHHHQRSFGAGEALTSSRTMRKTGIDGLLYSRSTQWALFKDFFAAGTFRISLTGEPGLPATVSVFDLQTLEDRKLEIAGAAGAEIELAHPGKYFLYLMLARPGRVASLEIARTHRLDAVR